MFPDDKGLFLIPNYHSAFHQVSWDFNKQLHHQSLGFSMHSNLSFIDTNPISIVPTSFSQLLSGFKEDSMPILSAVS
jgi:hypothetical protein